MQSAYVYAMAIARKFRNPRWFVIYTGNPKWLEITASLNRRESASNRHDVFCLVFIIKTEELIKSLTKQARNCK